MRERGRPATWRHWFAVTATLGAVVAPPGLVAAPTPPPPVPASPSPAPASARPSPAAPSRSWPATGGAAALYGRQCASCHGLSGEGTQEGPPLRGVGAASVDFMLSTGRMPPRTAQYEPEHRAPAVTPAQISDLVRYVSTFGPGGPPVPRVQPNDPQTGRELYAEHCAACHSATGMGATLTNGLVAPPLSASTPIQVAEAVRVGPGLMPAFPSSVLSDRDVDAVAAYVRALQGKGVRMDPGGLRLGRIGPVAEGTVAWVLGLGLLVLAVRGLGSRSR